jgi:hypothetical protein
MNQRNHQPSDDESEYRRSYILATLFLQRSSAYDLEVATGIPREAVHNIIVRLKREGKVCVAYYEMRVTPGSGANKQRRKIAVYKLVDTEA